ncbi:MAG TPA: sensor domain-containing diguanylate cyclase [Mycobacteriales bacterium]|jgi:cyclic di-GMP phosphodiesterase Gmr
MTGHTDHTAVVAERDLLAAVLDSAATLLVVFDRAGAVVRVNRSCEAITGVAAGDAVGIPAWEVICPETDPALFRATLAGVQPADFPLHFELLAVGPHGNRRRVAWTYTGITDDAGRLTHVVGAGVDVTEQRRAEAVLRQRAETDPLTGVLNRAAFESALGAHLDPAVGLGCGLLFCDVDHFKAVNDTYGHIAGDQVLIGITERLHATVRDSDIVARLGGDEFVILLPGGGALEVRALATRIERVMRRPHMIADELVRVGLSVGVRVANAGDEPATVLSAADADMYAVKARRGSRTLTVA